MLPFGLALPARCPAQDAGTAWQFSRPWPIVFITAARFLSAAQVHRGQRRHPHPGASPRMWDTVALRPDGALKAVAQPVANRFRSGNSCAGQFRKLGGAERADFFNRELGVGISQGVS